MKRIIAILLVALLTVGLLPASAFAVSENTPKEEVVYINLNADGSVKEIYVVNIFDLDTDGKIIDYGRYESIRNMTTNEKLGYSGDTVTVDAKAGKLYYEGKLSSKAMPWNIAIKYFLDGKEYKANEIAGKSGNLKITINITKNTDCIGNFFEGYALQASVTLDTKKCQDIKTNDATIANVGSSKQLSYTILPDNGADIAITAKVTDFEMKAIAINGIKLNLKIELDDGVIGGKIGEIATALQAVKEGAGALNDGSKELYDGTTLLNEKVGELLLGVGALNSGTGTLASGLSTITSKNKELLDGAYAAFAGICSASETLLNTELSKNGLYAVTLTPETYSDVLSDLLKAMEADAVYNTAYNVALKEVTAQVEANADALYKGYIDQNADAIYLTYLQSQSQAIYGKVVAQIFLEQLMDLGFTEEQAMQQIQSKNGQEVIAEMVDALPEEQKQQIMGAALANLTDEQKTQIRVGTLASLTEEQKAQIRNGYIDQLMKSKEVTDKITAAVSAAGTAAASVVSLKGQLDNYSLFYDGLKSYTNAVTEAASGANTLKLNMDTLYANVGILKTSVGGLNDGVKALYDGTTALKDGSEEFIGKIEGELSGEVDSMIGNATGSNVAIMSFVSEKNTNIDSVQFVIQTEAIEIAPAVAEPAVEEKLNFWQKLLRLFGLY